MWLLGLVPLHEISNSWLSAEFGAVTVAVLETRLKKSLRERAKTFKVFVHVVSTKGRKLYRCQVIIAR